VDFPDGISAEELIRAVIPGRAKREPGMRVVNLPIAVETVVPVVKAAAAAMAVIGDSQNAIDGANCSADTGADDASDCAPYRAGDTVAFIGTVLGATNDALGMAGLRQAIQGKQEGGAREKQAGRQTRRQVRGCGTSFVHL
jgi:hypothetical protein